jgi:hypothetical protein
VINDLLRKGLLAEAERAEPKVYVAPTFKTGLRPGIDPTRMNQLLDELEVEEYLQR